MLLHQRETKKPHCILSFYRSADVHLPYLTDSTGGHTLKPAPFVAEQQMSVNSRQQSCCDARSGRAHALVKFDHRTSALISSCHLTWGHAPHPTVKTQSTAILVAMETRAQDRCASFIPAHKHNHLVILPPAAQRHNTVSPQRKTRTHSHTLTVSMTTSLQLYSHSNSLLSWKAGKIRQRR